jgi:hypothetical protein
MKKLNDTQKFMSMLLVEECLQKKVRIGNCNDGGYIVPKDLGEINFVISAGINDDVSFDKYFADINIPVYQYDPTIDELPYQDKNFFFSKKPFGSYPGHSSETLDSILQTINIAKNNSGYLLKFDVEGSEYNALLNSSDAAFSNARVICGEFHMLNTINDKNNYEVIVKTLEKLKKQFFIYHIHVNTNSTFSLIDGMLIPSLLEITYLNRDHFPTKGIINMKGLDEIDTPNIIGQPQIYWNPAWYLL